MARVVREHTPPTAEEVQRVRVEECRNQGHTFQVVTTFGSLDPQSILCSRCGESWKVGAEKLDADDLVALNNAATFLETETDTGPNGILTTADVREITTGLRRIEERFK